MKRRLTTIAMMALVMGAFAQKLTVNVSGIRSNKGNIMVGVGDYKNNPMGMTGKALKANSTGVSVTFDSLPDGKNNVYVYHAEDADFNPAMFAQLNAAPTTQSDDAKDTKIPQGGLGITSDGKWEVVVNNTPQTLNFRIIYINSKK